MASIGCDEHKINGVFVSLKKAVVRFILKDRSRASIRTLNNSLRYVTKRQKRTTRKIWAKIMAMDPIMEPI